MSVFDKIVELNKDNVGVFIHGSRYSTDDARRFVCQLEKSDEGVNLKVEAHGPTIMSACAEALVKWERIINKGVEEFRGPLLEAPTTMGKLLNDEIPF